VYDGKCFPVWSLSQVWFKTSSNGFHGVSRVVLSTNCACLHVKFPKDFSKSFCRELFNVFRYSFLSRLRLKVKTILLNLTLIYCYVFLVSKYILIRQIVGLKQLCPIKSFLTFKNFNRVRRRLLVFWGTPSLTRIVTSSSLTSAKRVAIFIATKPDCLVPKIFMDDYYPSGYLPWTGTMG